MYAFAQLLFIIPVIYVGLAIGAFILVITMSKSGPAALAGIGAVIAVFGYLPYVMWLDSRDEKTRKATRSKYEETIEAQLAQSCLGTKAIPLLPSDKEVYILPGALTRKLDLDHAFSFLVQKQLKRLEVEIPDGRGPELIRQFVPPGSKLGNARIIAFEVLPAQDQRCEVFERWLEVQPSRIRPLRELGLAAQSCIGVSFGDEPLSRIQIGAHRVMLGVFKDQSPGHYTFVASDTRRGTVSAMATATLRPLPGGSHLEDACVDSREHRAGRYLDHLVTLDALFPDSSAAKPSIVLTQNPSFAASRPATSQDVSQSLAVRGPGYRWGRDAVSADGTVWVETDSQWQVPRIIHIASLQGDRIVKTRVALNESPIGDVAGILATDAEVRIVAMDEAKTRRWLLVYSRSGAPKVALELSDEQLAQIRNAPK